MDDLLEKRASAQIPIEQYSHFTMMMRKSLETIPGMILNGLQPNFANGAQTGSQWNFVFEN